MKPPKISTVLVFLDIFSVASEDTFTFGWTLCLQRLLPVLKFTGEVKLPRIVRASVVDELSEDWVRSFLVSRGMTQLKRRRIRIKPRPPGFPVCQPSGKGCAASHMTKQNNNMSRKWRQGKLKKTFFCLWDTKMRFLAFFVFILGFCSYEAKAEDQPVQTFVIPHSHMDVGWVYTIQVC